MMKKILILLLVAFIFVSFFNSDQFKNLFKAKEIIVTTTTSTTKEIDLKNLT